jgi:hypothetical protein
MNITQEPLFDIVPVYSPIIYTVEDLNIIGTFTKVKYIAEVYIGKDSGNLVTANNKVGTYKTTPNNKGVGIFDFSNVVRNFVDSDNLGSIVAKANASFFSAFKTVQFDIQRHSIHLIDRYCTNENSLRFMQVEFKVEFASTLGGTVSVASNIVVKSNAIQIYNGTAQHEDPILQSGKSFGIDVGGEGLNLILNENIANGKFLTNAPTTQYIGRNDYHTLAFFNGQNGSYTTGNTAQVNAISSNRSVAFIKFKFYKADGSTLTDIDVTNTPINGGKRGFSNESATKFIFIGVGMGNHLGRNIGFGSNHYNQTVKYTVQAVNNNDEPISQIYTFEIIEDDCKGFEKIRLAWLNRFGAWDYYSFTKKSVRNVNTSRTQYTQLSGTWNESTYKLDSFRGGKKDFKVKAKERITLNTDFINEENSLWLEELFTSPEVYIINEYQENDASGIINKYVQPVLVTSSTYTRKTQANDRLMQYSITIERSKERVIQIA